MTTWKISFKDVSKEYGVDVNLLKAVAQAESGMDLTRHHGVVQWELCSLCLQRHKSYGVTNPYDARQSITGGAKLLSWLLERLQWQCIIGVGRL